MDKDGKRIEVMRDVSHLRANSDGFLVTDLFGKSKYIQGQIKYLDLVDEHIVVLDKK
jgi:predicted RNA-binding protein